MNGGEILYSGPPDGLREIEASQTRRFLFVQESVPERRRRTPQGWLRLLGIILIVFGVLLAALAWYLFSRSRDGGAQPNIAGP